MRHSLIVLSLSCVLLAACNKGGDTSTATTAPAATPAAPAAAPAAPAPVATADRVGIAACDDYLDKYQACVANKVPEAARATLVSSLDATRASWKNMASNTATAGSLEAACKQATDAAKQSMSAYGCTF
jgi:hypothetical protein